MANAAQALQLINQLPPQLRVNAFVGLKKRIEAIKKKKEKTKALKLFKEYEFKSLDFTRNVCGEYIPECLEPIFHSWDKNQITVVISANGIGKSFTGGCIARAAFCIYEGAEVYALAAPPESNLKFILWKEISRAMRRAPDGFKNVDVTRDMTAINGDQLLKGITIPSSNEDAEARTSGKHAPMIGFIADEGDGIPEDPYKGIDSCLSGGIARLMIFFNARRAANPVSKRYINNKRANVIRITAFDHPNVIEGRDVIAGAVTREITLQRMNTMSRLLRNDEAYDHECYEVPEFLVGKTCVTESGDGEFPPMPSGPRRVTDNEFYYKVLARFPAQSEQQLISRVDLKRCFDNYEKLEKDGELPERKAGRLGFDVAGEGNDMSMIYHRLRNVLSYVKSWKGVNPAIGTRYAKEICEDVESDEIFVDASGLGSTVAPNLRFDGINASGVMVSESVPAHVAMREGNFYRIRDLIAWRFAQWLKLPDSALPYSKELEIECLAWEYWRENGKIRISKGDDVKKLIGWSPDRFWSCALTFADSEALFLPKLRIKSHIFNGAFSIHMKAEIKFAASFYYSPTKPSCLLISALHSSGRFLVLGEFYGHWIGVKPFVDRVRAIEMQYGVKVTECYAGSELGDVNYSENAKEVQSDDLLLYEFSKEGLSFVKASKDRLTGWRLLREYLDSGKDANKLKFLGKSCYNTIRTLPLLTQRNVTSHAEKEVDAPDTSCEASAAHCLRILVMQVNAPDKIKNRQKDRIFNDVKPRRNGIKF